MRRRDLAGIWWIWCSLLAMGALGDLLSHMEDAYADDKETKEVTEHQESDSKPFEQFTDLDIILSTGESSEELQRFLQDLNATEEEDLGSRKVPCARVGFYRHPADCTRFYHCAEYRAPRSTNDAQSSGPYANALYRCPGGLVYDESRAACVWPSWSEPCRGSGELLPVPTRKYTCLTSGFHVDPGHCRWFYYCSDLGDGRLEAFEFQCPSDLLGFDEGKLLCNWKWTVPECSSNETNTHENTPPPAIQEVQKADNRKRTKEHPNIHPLAIQRGQKADPNSRKGTKENSNPQGILSWTTPLTTSNYRRLKLSSKANETANGESFPSLDDTASPPDQEQHFTTKIHTPPNKTHQQSTEAHARFASSQSERSTDEKHQLPEKKYGTAVWRRSWINDDKRIQPRTSRLDDPLSNTGNRNGREENGKTTQPRTSHRIDAPLDLLGETGSKTNDAKNDGKTTRPFRTLRSNASSDTEYSNPQPNDTENNRHSNENDLGIYAKQASLPPSFEGDAEEKRFFKGRVIKISPRQSKDRMAEQLPQHADDVIKKDRRMSEQNTEGDKSGIASVNTTDKVSDKHAVPQKISKRQPFVNVRCSKLDDRNGQHTTFGCTSEVSLIIQAPSGKDAGNYILKDDQITRTAHQESQEIGHLRFFDGGSNVERTKGKIGRSNQGKDLPTSLQPSGNESLPTAAQQEFQETGYFDGSSIRVRTAGEIGGSNQSPDSPTSSVLPRNERKKSVMISDILKDDSITRTANQDSQEIGHSKKLDDGNNRALSEIGRLNQIRDSTTSFQSPGNGRNESAVFPDKFNKQWTTFELAISSNTKMMSTEANVVLPEMTNDVDFEFQKSSITKSVEINDILEHSKQNKTEKLTTEENGLRLSEAEKEKIVAKENSDNISSRSMMPIPFYPQGVLLNIDLTHVNEIPPQILLEVDGMLRKYMEDKEEIDVDLLERKLNASVVRMEKKHFQDKEPAEIMEVIKAIENILNNTSRELESEDQHQGNEKEISTLEDVDFTENITTSTNSIALEHKITTNSINNVSNNSASIDSTDLEQPRKGKELKIPILSEKIQNSDLTSQNASNSEPFGRRRLFRKFRYPSIREQLERQHRSSVKATSKDTIPDIISNSGVKIASTPTYTYPLLRNKALSPNLVSRAIGTKNTYAKEQFHVGRIAETEEKTSTLPLENGEKIFDDIDEVSSIDENDDKNALRLVRPQYDNTPSWDAHEAVTQATHSTQPISSHSTENAEAGITRRLQNTETINRNFPTPAYRLASARQGNTGGKNAQKVPSLRYGDRTYVSQRTFQHEGYAYSSGNLESLRGNLPIARNFHENTANFGEIDSHYDLRGNNIQTNPESYFTNIDKPITVSDSSKRQNTIRERPILRSSDEVSFYTRILPQGTPFYSTMPSFITEPDRNSDNRRQGLGQHDWNPGNNVRQRTKRKKLRVLVKKLTEDGASGADQRARIPTDHDDTKNGKQDAISESVLGALRNRIIQKHAKNGEIQNLELQIQYQNHVWNVPFVDEKSKMALSPAVCTRPGLFQHPRDCNMFYECFWDKWLQKFTLHVFTCPIRLVYDTNVRGCGRSSTDSHCTNSVKKR